MNDELYRLYQTRLTDFERVILQFSGTDLAGPLLMSPNATYGEQENPLLIVGQETKGWGYLQGHDIRKQMVVYEEFNLGDGYYSSPFWNVTRKVERALGAVPYSCAWTNLSKFDVDGGRSYGEQEQLIATVDDLLVAEVNILKPKVCLFFTGPDFDSRIQRIFAGITYQSVPDWPIREMALLKHPDLPAYTFRTYHPNYLRRSGLEPGFIEFISGLPFSADVPPSIL
ncbi:hypothetical protein ACFST9_14505 [Hymenobacter monticola]|uniref:Uracil-DNA glycosylase n=2 Tax=Hymenobacter monticola TaxID=1705399 RepID=A0ABY4BEH3_9BACT|nr:hypothetical protein [Hymenobacter monticola]UOE36677.1 hypothetical protein MTP16_25195 [Hymenobacter monticola]